MTPSAVGKLVEKWRGLGQQRASEFGLKLKLTDFQICADELEALATAPPEQAAPVKSTLPVGVSVLVTNGGLVLLGERINNTASGLLSTPGGRIEQNEDIFACAVRETQEETGLSLTRDLLKVIAWREHFRFGQHYFMFYVHAPQSFGTVVNKEPDKCKAWGWRTISQIKAEETTEPLDVLALLAPSDPPQAVSAGALSDLRMEIFDALAESRVKVVRACDGEEMAEDVEAWSTREQYDLEQHTEAVMVVLAAHDQKVRENVAREHLAMWMIEHSFATGHGDTFEELLKEFAWQFMERQEALFAKENTAIHDQKVRAEVLAGISERLLAKAFPMSPHGEAEGCVTLADLNAELRAVASGAVGKK